MTQTEKLLLFWGTHDIYSNWHPAVFTVEGVTYQNSEQYMMAAKARLFQDTHSELQVLAEHDPKRVKALGRAVQGYQETVWCQHREKVMFDACLAKFQQNPDLARELLATGHLHLVEASPYDRIWGIGLGEHDRRALDPRQWQGLNLLGNALMRVRTELQILHPAGLTPPTTGSLF